MRMTVLPPVGPCASMPRLGPQRGTSSHVAMCYMGVAYRNPMMHRDRSPATPYSINTEPDIVHPKLALRLMIYILHYPIIRNMP